ncbi:N-acetyltransferase [Longispora fulva]|uniref:Ribosomal-protein-alanine N-acetyltransferase n=1 Tax=Longispora fulva TaxID=619741 RepID=A0A8J7KFW7_9ACTN|nr:GNAT family N-acetyltransferase [Longispora fulva]MBG6136695.1 ribosomal-protein-alanine N-acetyltransferase [Longispora fulva]GIG59864.1 N-acetyltransferase [Longispora fulva]
MPELQRLRADHVPALLGFERENRAYFAAAVPDRGDEYFAEFDARIAALLAEQATGGCHFHVLVAAEGTIVGRVNLVDVADGAAELGYRIAEHATGRGLARAAVAQICALAATGYGLDTLRAKTTVDNHASRAVLARTGFVPAGETVLSGRPGLLFVRDLLGYPPPEVVRGGHLVQCNE